MIKNDLVGDAHFQDPFCIGRVDPNRPFVHVFDEMSLQCVMHEIDTTPDFIEYPKRRAVLLATPNPVVIAPGEEELLANYIDDQQRKAKIDANEISYLWDHLVEHLIKELPERASPQPDGDPSSINRETALRVMASETRFSRRMYGRHLAEVLESTRTLAPRKPFVRVAFIRERT
jgi:hypothetical protein